MSRSVIFFLLVLVGSAISCVPPDCDHVDCDSCGNACCTVDVLYPDKDADFVTLAMIKLFKEGGPDGRYTLKQSYNQTKEGSEHKQSFQSIHTTKVHHYNDTQFFYVNAEPKGSVTVRGFSISNIAGANCDEGQNYKNVVGFMKGLDFMFKGEPKIIYGCSSNVVQE